MPRRSPRWSIRRRRCAILTHLARVGGLGRYGFYEALDYTPARLPEGQKVAVVRAFMAHHQGMTIVAIANALLDAPMRARFHAEPMMQATELLLQERPPRDVAVARPSDAYAKSAARVRNFELPGGRHYTAANDALAGHASAVQRQLQRDADRRRFGLQPLARHRRHPLARGPDLRRLWLLHLPARRGDPARSWSAGVPALWRRRRTTTSVTFNEDRAVFIRRDGTLTTTLEVLVPSGDNAEVRQVSVVNDGSTARDIEFTSYAELVLTTQAADIAHPAFAKLSVQTEYLPEHRDASSPPGGGARRASRKSGRRISPSCMARRSARSSVETDRMPLPRPRRHGARSAARCATAAH